METTDRDSTRAEILAAIAVFLGLIVMLRSIWLALAAEIALGVGIGWTFGWATISVGELNLLSIVFLIALIGIGMDYLVQVLTRYRSEARRHARPKAIWARVFRHVAAPINTACFGGCGRVPRRGFYGFSGRSRFGDHRRRRLAALSSERLYRATRDADAYPRAVGVNVALRSVSPPPIRGARRLLLPVVWLFGLRCCIPFIPQAQFNPNLLDLQAHNWNRPN